MGAESDDKDALEKAEKEYRKGVEADKKKQLEERKKDGKERG